MSLPKLILATFLVLACAGPARAETLLGRVVAVADGDTVTLLEAGRPQHRIRLAGIDAPEKGRPFGERARTGLVVPQVRP